MKTLLDTGPLVAILDAQDSHHDWAVRHAGQLKAPFLTCEAVFSEAHFLLSDPPGAQNRLLELMASDRIEISFSYADHASRVHALMRTYSDQPMSFADACLVRMSEIYADSRIFTVDSDFRVYQKHGETPIPVLAP